MTTLLAIVDKDGDIRGASVDGQIEAWAEHFGRAPNDKEIYAMNSYGYHCTELHTYDPSKQVVIDREVYKACLDNIEAFLSAGDKSE